MDIPGGESSGENWDWIFNKRNIIIKKPEIMRKLSSDKKEVRVKNGIWMRIKIKHRIRMGQEKILLTEKNVKRYNLKERLYKKWDKPW